MEGGRWAAHPALAYLAIPGAGTFGRASGQLTARGPGFPCSSGVHPPSVKSGVPRLKVRYCPITLTGLAALTALFAAVTAAWRRLMRYGHGLSLNKRR